MTYTLQNNGSGSVCIRAVVPASLASAFLAFFDQKSRENHPVIKSSSHEKNEAYFIELNAKTLLLFEQCINAGMSRQASVSEVNKKLKVLGFHNTSYDIVKTLLTRQGCFKTSAV